MVLYLNFIIAFRSVYIVTPLWVLHPQIQPITNQKSQKKQNLVCAASVQTFFLSSLNKHIAAIYITLSVVSNLEIVQRLQEHMSRLFANSFYTKNLSISRFWYSQGSCNQPHINKKELLSLSWSLYVSGNRLRKIRWFSFYGSSLIIELYSTRAIHPAGWNMNMRRAKLTPYLYFYMPSSAGHITDT